MNVDLGEAEAGVAVAISVIDDYIAELARVGRLQTEFLLKREVFGVMLDVTVSIDVPRFELAVSAAGGPYTRLVVTGSIEARVEGQPESDPLSTAVLDAKVKLALRPVPDVPEPGSTDPPPNPAVGLVYEGVDGTPAAPVTEADLADIFTTGETAELIAGVRLSLAGPLTKGLDPIVFPDGPSRRTEWDVEVVLMPAAEGTDDSFACFVARPGRSALPALTESFVASMTGMGLVYSRSFLDEVLEAGAAGVEGTTVKKAKITKYDMFMGDDDVRVDGKGYRPFWWLVPDIDFAFKGPVGAQLVRGTTSISFNPTSVKLDVDDSDEVFLKMAKWFTTILAGAMLITGVGWLTAVGIGLWFSAVPYVWKETDLQPYRNNMRESLASALGVQLSVLAASLGDDREVQDVSVDATPDSLVIAQGNMVLLAQIIVVAFEAQMRSAEYSKRLRRFAIFELDDGRRFRAQELARLMASGKITVPGFHHVNAEHVRADPDDVDANNLLRRFRSNLTEEPVAKSMRP